MVGKDITLMNAQVKNVLKLKTLKDVLQVIMILRMKEQMNGESNMKVKIEIEVIIMTVEVEVEEVEVVVVIVVVEIVVGRDDASNVVRKDILLMLVRMGINQVGKNALNVVKLVISHLNVLVLESLVERGEGEVGEEEAEVVEGDLGISLGVGVGREEKEEEEGSNGGRKLVGMLELVVIIRNNKLIGELLRNLSSSSSNSKSKSNLLGEVNHSSRISRKQLSLRRRMKGGEHRRLRKADGD